MITRVATFGIMHKCYRSVKFHGINLDLYENEIHFFQLHHVVGRYQHLQQPFREKIWSNFTSRQLFYLR